MVYVELLARDLIHCNIYCPAYMHHLSLLLRLFAARQINNEKVQFVTTYLYV
jgi:hypothetical protein